MATAEINIQQRSVLQEFNYAVIEAMCTSARPHGDEDKSVPTISAKAMQGVVYGHANAAVNGYLAGKFLKYSHPLVWLSFMALENMVRKPFEKHQREREANVAIARLSDDFDLRKEIAQAEKPSVGKIAAEVGVRVAGVASRYFLTPLVFSMIMGPPQVKKTVTDIEALAKYQYTKDALRASDRFFDFTKEKSIDAFDILYPADLKNWHYELPPSP